MATSSIIENIRIDNPKALEEYVNAMENFANTPVGSQNEYSSHLVSDSDRIKAFAERALSKRGLKL